MIGTRINLRTILSAGALLMPVFFRCGRDIMHGLQMCTGSRGGGMGRWMPGAVIAVLAVVTILRQCGRGVLACWYASVMNGHRIIPIAALVILLVFAGVAVADEQTGCCADPQMLNSSDKHSVSSEIDDALSDKIPVFVFFYAEWCHFCEEQKPVIDELEQEYADKIAFIRVNAEENPQAMNDFGVTGFPVMFLIVDKNEEGYVYQEFSGFTEEDVLKESFDYVVDSVSEDISSDISNQPDNNSLSSEIDNFLYGDKSLIPASASASNNTLINEIMFNPMVEDSGKEWIEIYNGDETKNINGWTISNRTGEVVATLPNWDFPNGTYLVVHFGSGTNDNNFTEGNGHFYTDDSIEVFNNTEDECALYNSTPGASSIVDFVSWSSDGSYSGGIAHGYAVNAGIWDSGDFFDVKWDVNYVGDGESIGRDKYSTDYDQPDDWDDHGGVESHYATKGGPNRGPIYSPYDGIMKTQEMINQILIDRGYDVIYANHTKLEIIEEDNETYVYAEHNFETKYHPETVFFHGTALFHWYETDEGSSESKINVELQSDYNAIVKLDFQRNANWPLIFLENR